MTGYTDKPINNRPPCPECGSHKWSFDGTCLSVDCTPFEYYTRMILEGKNKKKKKEKIELPSWLRIRPKTKAKIAQAKLYAKQMGLELPWDI